jgi:NDP-sugar pyrophosphorylase family protein
MNGDILSLINYDAFYNFAGQKDNLLTVTIKKIIIPYAFGNILFDGDLVTNVEEKPDITTYALAGIYVMKPEILQLIPANQYYGIDLLIKQMLGSNLPITKYELQEYWLDIGQIQDYEKAQNIYQDYFAKDNLNGI